MSEVDRKESSTKTTHLPHFNQSFVLKACIFATGLSGIVAEYVLSTLASYLLGNAVLQWTLTLTFMLFAMGIGSRISKSVRGPLLDIFIVVEFTLSILCAISAACAYFLSAYIMNIAPIIYLLSMIIGTLIGLEIPLATRLNDHFEELRVNISSVMEHDYYGALVGGLFFDDINEPGFDKSFEFIRNAGDSFLAAYRPIVEKRVAHRYGERQREFQQYRRGRYVEFNLLYDRGTLFGLQSGGRTESILMSLPPTVRWAYDWAPEAGSPEEILYTDYLKARDWLGEENG